MSLKVKIILALIAGVLLSGILISTHVFILLHEPFNKEDKMFFIQSGEGFSKINYKLYKQQIISNPRVFHYWVKFNGSLTKFRQGDFRIPKGASLIDVYNILLFGKAELVKITIPEGKNLYEIAEIFDSKEILKKEDFISNAKDIETIKRIVSEENIQWDLSQFPHSEGLLYPDTYHVNKKISAYALLKIMLKQANKQFKTLDMTQAPLNLNFHQIITLASIVEKETGAAWERPTIAGVYLNRLRKNMRLYADPTTIYGIWENFDGNLKKKHLQQKTAYNTYRIDGLPLGPIANPSLEAIKAVLNPKKHDYLYFVSKNDGTHVFTKSYKEHKEAIKKWQLNRKNRKNRSWRDLKSKN